MTQTANNYGTVLFELGVEKETVEEMKRIFSLTRRIAARAGLSGGIRQGKTQADSSSCFRRRSGIS